VGHARNRSVRFDREAAREQIDSLAKLTKRDFNHEYIIQTLFHPEPAHTFGYHLFGFVAEGVPPSASVVGTKTCTEFAQPAILRQSSGSAWEVLACVDGNPRC
jgi:hypothetical protein